jgi:hypothetical protein
VHMGLPTIGRVFGSVVAVITLVVAALNGAFMLLSPRRWFDLPEWLSAKGTLTRERYSKGAGALQIRILGAGLLGTMLWICSRLFADH